jgi:phenylpyruvate tautomerase PptA (4-oxalocrotonate tautomerase family)
MRIPTPEPGLVISFGYLWHREHQAGQEEGRKDRPAVIVITVEREKDAATLVTVLPITHSAPDKQVIAIEIPRAVKQHLGLDDERSWIVVSEGNEFQWAGYDLRKIPRTDRYDYGFLPPRFFNQIVEAFGKWYETGRYASIPRD